MRRTAVVAAWLVAATLVVAAGPVNRDLGSACPRPDGSPSIARLDGPTRVDTAIAVARATTDPDADLDEVVLAADDAPADATAGAVVGAGLAAPMLLTDGAALSPAVRDFLVAADRDADGGTAWVVGGPAVVEDDVLAALDDLGFTAQRLAGATRYETAEAAAALVTARIGDAGPVVVATGRDWPDAATGAALAAARGGVLRLVDGQTATDVEFVRDRDAVVVGGPTAVSDDVADRVADRAATFRRLAGEDRAATAAAVAASLPDAEAVVATAAAWPDPVVGATLAARRGGVVLLTDPAALSRPTAALLAGREATVLGGTAAIPRWLAHDVADAAAADPGAPVVLDQNILPCTAVPTVVGRPVTLQLTTNGTDLRLESVAVTPEGGGTTSGIASSFDRDEGGVLQFFLEVTPDVVEPHDVAVVLVAEEDGAVRRIRRGWRLDVLPPFRTAPEGWLVAAGTSAVAGTDGPLTTYSVEIADGLESRQDLAAFAAAVETTLHDATRGWTSRGERRLQRVDDPGAARVRVLLATPATVDRLCRARGVNTAGIYSCWTGTFAALNSDRWFGGVSHVPDLQLYRDYLVNHEVGHGLGFGHRACPGEGQRAPVMMQLTKSTYGCDPYGFPY